MGHGVRLCHVDTLDPTEFASVVTAITSAFGDPTRRDIYLFVQGSEPGATASEVADHFTLHANVARHHLDKLCAGGYLEISTDRPAGAAGRPSKRYRAREQNMAINVPVRQDDLLMKLLGRSFEELGLERSTAMAEQVGIEYGSAMAASMGDQSARSFRSALHAIAAALSSHGFGAHAEVQGNSLKLITEHCPFGDLAVEHPVICALDRGMAKGLMDNLHSETHVALSTATETGGDHCVTVFTSTTPIDAGQVVPLPSGTPRAKAE